MIEILVPNDRYVESLSWVGDPLTGHMVCSIDDWLDQHSIEICKWSVAEPGPIVIFGQTYTGSIRKGWIYSFESDQRDHALLFKLTWC